MLTQIKSPVPAGTGDPGLEITLRAYRSKIPRKWERVLRAFVEGRRFNRFQAERELHDHCLHTTVSVLQGKGLVVLRCDEVVPGFERIPTHVCSYWLDPRPENLARASALLDRIPAQEGR